MPVFENRKISENYSTLMYSICGGIHRKDIDILMNHWTCFKWDFREQHVDQYLYCSMCLTGRIQLYAQSDSACFFYVRSLTQHVSFMCGVWLCIFIEYICGILRSIFIECAVSDSCPFSKIAKNENHSTLMFTPICDLFEVECCSGEDTALPAL